MLYVTRIWDFKLYLMYNILNTYRVHINISQCTFLYTKSILPMHFMIRHLPFFRNFSQCYLGTNVRIKGNSFSIASFDALLTFIFAFNLLFIFEQVIELIKYVLETAFNLFNKAMIISREDPSRLMTKEWKVLIVGYVQGRLGKRS